MCADGEMASRNLLLLLLLINFSSFLNLFCMEIRKVVSTTTF